MALVGPTEGVALVFQLIAGIGIWYAMLLIRAPDSDNFKIKPTTTQLWGILFVEIIAVSVWLRDLLVIRGAPLQPEPETV